MPRSVIPVLSVGQDQLTRPADQIAYILRHAFYNPGWTSSYLEPYLISLQKLFAENSNNLEEMSNKFIEKLQYILKEMYGSNFQVNAELYSVDILTKGVKISITDANNNLVLNSDDIRIKDGKCYIRQTLGEIE